jgi:transcription-repair coupling factor (superfamily II helicase)
MFKLTKKPGYKNYWPPLPGASLAYQLSQLYENNPAFLSVIVTPDIQLATKLERELFAFSDIPVYLFPDWETLPYDNFSPHQDIVSERLKILANCSLLKQGIVILPISTLIQKLPPINFISSLTFHLSLHQKIDADLFKSKLIDTGYHYVSQVMEHGEFAIRGAIIDVFPMGAPHPIRIDLFDDQIDSLRWFDATTQRTIEKTDEIILLPAHEFPLNAEAIKYFRTRWREQFEGSPALCPVYQDISEGIASTGIEYYLPLFFEKMASFFDYLPHHAQFFIYPQNHEAAIEFWQDIETRYEQLRHDHTRPILPPNQLYFTLEDTFAFLKKWPLIELNSPNASEADQKKAMQMFGDLPNLELDNKSTPTEPLEKLTAFIQQHPTYSILFCAESSGRKETLLQLLNSQHLFPKSYADIKLFLANRPTTVDLADLAITVAPIDAGFIDTNRQISFIAEAQLYGRRVMQRRRRKTTASDPENMIRNLAELSIGHPVVHIDCGVGRYLGLQNIVVGQTQGEYLTLEYAGGDKLYVPVSSLHFISRYSGSDSEHAPLHKLGTDHWEKAKKKAFDKIKDTAAELLEIYANRALKVRPQFNFDESTYALFSNTFQFEETPDQAKAIEDVLTDLQSTKPMDRLVCGDVGFGKTEVAMRAAFMTVMNQKQVAILVPTTLLAEQHFQNFKDRMSDWPIRIEVLSRFVANKTQTKIIEDLTTGKVDIVIGTHKLLQSQIKFQELGLLIIDEEHRFGVNQKEKIKSLKSEVDILTLTATPIPRTLNLSLSMIRDLSIIATPPLKRLAIKTFVREFNQPLVTEAIVRELKRGGQVYYLHNDVATIEKTARELEAFIPSARIAVAHGQMPERLLEQVMADFYHQRFNILICSTIIETGIDVPSANTIIIERADKFGLAQLHQLRGRVGRSHHQAYAYCLTPPFKTISKDALKRLEALESLEELGSGFMLATQDLEIRGAGELLGEGQSGNLHTIGYHLYMEMLEKTVKALKSGQKIKDIDPAIETTEVDCHLPAFIPDTYLNDVHTRLMLYKKIASAKSKADLEELQVDMIDRFGLLPDETKNLFKLTELKLLASSLGIKKIDAGMQGGKIDFTNTPNVDSHKIIALIQTQPRKFQIKGSSRLLFNFDAFYFTDNNSSNSKDNLQKEAQEKLRQLEGILKMLST